MHIDYRGSGEELEIRFANSPWIPLLQADSLQTGEGAALCQWVAQQWSRMPGASVNSQVELPGILREPISDVVVFYPGSFNPWHEGHRSCVELTPQRPLVVVPDANPWKDNTRLKEHCPWREVLEIIKHAPSDIHLYPGFHASSISNPTVNWLPLTLWHKRALTLGADSFIALPRWSQPERLLRSLESLYVVPRQIAKEQIAQAQSEIAALAPDVKIYLLPEHPYEDVSSTAIRMKN